MVERSEGDTEPTKVTDINSIREKGSPEDNPEAIARRRRVLELSRSGRINRLGGGSQ